MLFYRLGSRIRKVENLIVEDIYGKNMNFINITKILQKYNNYTKKEKNVERVNKKSCNKSDTHNKLCMKNVQGKGEVYKNEI